LVKLRLRRMGRKKAPIYKIVAADSRARRDGRFIEAVGQYDPNTNPAKVDILEDRALYWLSTGAQPTVTVRNILSHKGLMLKSHLGKKGADDNKIAAEFSKWESLQESKLQRLNDKKLRRKEKKKKAAEKPAETTATTPAAEQPAAEEQSA
jgi:small subunit ribosomal protein S16